jgi:outer membrane protein OmpA-like peptidoglycan-associated protein
MTSAGTDSPAPVSGKIAPTSLVTPHLPPAPKLPALDSQALPRLTPSKSFASLPTPSQVPAATDLTQDAVPQTPSLPDGSDPLQPPSLRDALPSAPVLHEGVTHPSHIPGNHLTLESSLSTVLFTRGSGNIDGDIIMTLDKVATILQDNPDVRISLIAYADNTGSTPRDARRLSLTRALAVRDYLASKNVSESRVDVHAEGANTHKGNMDRVDIQVN